VIFRQASERLADRVEGEMNKTIRAMTVAAVAVVSGAANAADLPRGPTPYYAPAPVATTYNWGGIYAGANAGYE
jgi:hypothetical protein